MAQLKGWLGDMGMEAESLSKKAVAEMIAETDGEVEELLRLRLLMAFIQFPVTTENVQHPFLAGEPPHDTGFNG